MNLDPVAAGFMLLAAAALTAREQILKDEVQTWPPTQWWMRWIINGVVFITVTRAVYLWNRGAEPFSMHTDPMGVLLTASWTCYHTGMLVNAMKHSTDWRMRGLFALWNRRQFEASRFPPGTMGTEPTDAIEAMAAVATLEKEGWQTWDPMSPPIARERLH